MSFFPIEISKEVMIHFKYSVKSTCYVKPIHGFMNWENYEIKAGTSRIDTSECWREMESRQAMQWRRLLTLSTHNVECLTVSVT